MSIYASNNEIKSLLIDVSEEIENKNLKKFIFTSLKLNNFEISKNDFVHINFISELKQYQVLIFPNHYKNTIFQIFELYYLDEKDFNKFDLYFNDDFFCLYKNGKFYYFQNLQSEIFIEELIEFINKKFSITLDSFKVIQKKSCEDLKNEYSKKALKNKLENFNIKNDYSFKIYVFYILIIISCFTFYLYENQIKNEENETKIVEENQFDKLKKEHFFTSISLDFNNIVELLKKYDLNLKLFEYKDNKQKIVFSSFIKSDIYSFFGELKDNLITQEVNYFENEKNYEAVIYVKLSK
ncbi:hypothetical protein [Arcobacter caeni]|uniref:Uncharacterized protein n=1 Tax=Arcobacter caeni TaxID=1912877 RepID=A0A363D335_9BACT|nr:hypothetical protein [Arcobacter caeni]PUE65497.1 hypothetical protein B0174_04025 [Arcobacter caeni]